MLNLIKIIIVGFLHDFKNQSFQTSLARAARATKLFLELDLVRKLLNNAVYQKHVSFIDANDKLFFLTYKHYLVNGLTARQRIKTALFHYEHEKNKFDDLYYKKVYLEEGLKVWVSNFNDTVYDIRLMPANDVLYEGGCSLVLHVNGERVCVMSYAMVPKNIFLRNQLNSNNDRFSHNDDALILVTRKQLTGNHSYQNEYNKAFDRVMPAHMCMSALAAIAQAQGCHSFLGISSDAHPSLKPEYAHVLKSAYDQFWISLNGQELLPYGYLTQLPLYMSPIDSLDAKNRKRALLRRGHLDDVYEQALKAMQNHLLQK